MYVGSLPVIENFPPVVRKYAECMIGCARGCGDASTQDGYGCRLRCRDQCEALIRTGADVVVDKSGDKSGGSGGGGSGALDFLKKNWFILAAAVLVIALLRR